jgi:hypothetical protein
MMKRMKTAKRRRSSQWSRNEALNLRQTTLEQDDSAESGIDMDGSGKRRVDIIVRFTVEEMGGLKKICQMRDCAPEDLLRELALCELAQFRSLSKPYSRVG